MVGVSASAEARLLRLDIAHLGTGFPFAAPTAISKLWTKNTSCGSLTREENSMVGTSRIAYSLDGVNSGRDAEFGASSKVNVANPMHRTVITRPTKPWQDARHVPNSTQKL